MHRLSIKEESTLCSSEALSGASFPGTAGFTVKITQLKTPVPRDAFKAPGETLAIHYSEFF
jgi:hypothetical protein